MKVDTIYTITLSGEEAKELKTLLGNLTDTQKKEFGLSDAGVILTSEIWECLPYPNDEEI